MAMEEHNDKDAGDKAKDDKDAEKDDDTGLVSPTTDSPLVPAVIPAVAATTVTPALQGKDLPVVATASVRGFTPSASHSDAATQQTSKVGIE